MHFVNVAGRADHQNLLGEASVPELFGVGNFGHAECTDARVTADGGQGNKAKAITISLDDGKKLRFASALFERFQILTDGGGIDEIAFHVCAPLLRNFIFHGCG